MGHPYIFDFPISLYFNLKVLPFKKAYKLPFRISFRTKIRSLYRGVIDIDAPIHHNMIHIGAPGVEGVTGYRKNYIRTGRPGNCSITFKGASRIAQGCLLNVDRGELILGNNFGANENLYISCNKAIHIGNDVSCGWDVSIMDSDNHRIQDSAGKINYSRGIKIGNHVWLTSHVSIMKNSSVPNNSVVASHSVVTKDFENNNILIGGSPAKTLKEHITWSSEETF